VSWIALAKSSGERCGPGSSAIAAPPEQTSPNNSMEIVARMKNSASSPNSRTCSPYTMIGRFRIC